MTVRVPRPDLHWYERLYVVQIVSGLLLTLGHALRVLLWPERLRTREFPEVAPAIPRCHRSRHRLMQRPDGSPRCVACFLCSTACPARCIRIVAEQTGEGRIEKRPKSFEIDLLLCVYCGFCVEACPCDAIRMDTNLAVNVQDARRKFRITRDELLAWDPKDYPADDVVSQEAPGGSRHAEALARFRSGDPNPGQPGGGGR